MSVTSPDFESGAYTNFATPARMLAKCQAILVAPLPHRQPQTTIQMTEFKGNSQGQKIAVYQSPSLVIQLPSRFAAGCANPSEVQDPRTHPGLEQPTQY